MAQIKVNVSDISYFFPKLCEISFIEPRCPVDVQKTDGLLMVANKNLVVIQKLAEAAEKALNKTAAQNSTFSIKLFADYCKKGWNTAHSGWKKDLHVNFNQCVTNIDWRVPPFFLKPFQYRHTIYRRERAAGGLEFGIELLAAVISVATIPVPGAGGVLAGLSTEVGKKTALAANRGEASYGKVSSDLANKDTVIAGIPFGIGAIYSVLTVAGMWLSHLEQGKRDAKRDDLLQNSWFLSIEKHQIQVKNAVLEVINKNNQPYNETVNAFVLGIIGYLGINYFPKKSRL